MRLHPLSPFGEHTSWLPFLISEVSSDRLTSNPHRAFSTIRAISLLCSPPLSIHRRPRVSSARLTPLTPDSALLLSPRVGRSLQLPGRLPRLERRLSRRGRVSVEPVPARRRVREHGGRLPVPLSGRVRRPRLRAAGRRDGQVPLPGRVCGAHRGLHTAAAR